MHDHDSHAGGHDHDHSRASISALRAAFAITSGVLVLEAVGGWLTGSMALLADAGHMLTDTGALGVALLAAHVSRRPRTARKSFGYGRAEILGALANGLLLGGVSVAIAIEAVERLRSPVQVDAVPMLSIAVVGLIANLASARILMGSADQNLNVRAALLHVIGDALGSVAAIIAGISVLMFDFTAADAIAALCIALLLIVSAARLVRESADILLEGAPRHLDLETITREVGEMDGVLAVHDLHIWTVSSGFLAMSAHVDLTPGADPESTRRAVHRLLYEQYSIHHTTIQTEATPPLLQIQDPRRESDP
jgi:cobalt-zinc-cadmium efflux system protein